MTTTEALYRMQAWNTNANQVYEATVTELPDSSTRVAHWAAAVAFPDALQTTNAANVACRKERLLLNETKTSGGRLLQLGDILTLTTFGDSRTTLPLKEAAIPTFLNTRLNLITSLTTDTHATLRVLYEDDCMAIVCKPAGIHSMSYGTMSSLCLDHLLPLLLTPPSLSQDALSAPLPRHRLDARVAGPVVVAKTRRAMVDISNSFEERLVHKTYRALLVGNVDNRDIGESFDISTIDDDDGRTSHTHVTILDRTRCAVDGMLTHVALYPTTGRRHQLRKHCAHELEAPILGDDLYHDGEDGEDTDDDKKRSKVRKRIGLYLYCKRVAVPHPTMMNDDDSTRMMIAAEIDEPLRFARHKQKAAKGYQWQQNQNKQAP